MEKLIKEMEEYALLNSVPIMQKEGIEFVQKCVEKYNIKTILEIGTAIGYSAIQMCRLHEDIKVVSIERDEVRYNKAVENVKKANMEDRITLLLGDALEEKIEGKYDLIFIDAAKAQYIKFFERYEENLAENGIILSDNLKFHGFVEHPELTTNRNTRQLVRKIAHYVDWLKENEDYDTQFFDLGDGVAISKKKLK